MSIPNEKEKSIKKLATESLDVLNLVSSNAKEKLKASNIPSSVDSLAGNVNTWTDSSSVKKLDTITESNISDYRTLIREPIIARIVVLNENQEKKVYYIGRAAPLRIDAINAEFSSYNTDIGRLAESPPGEEIEVRIGDTKEYFEILECIHYHPKFNDEWDSIDNVIEDEKNNKITVKSFRSFLNKISKSVGSDDLLGNLLKSESSSEIVFEGIHRKVIDRMSLRDQPTLDKYQGEIFRLPIQKQLLILGPPGTGKTTTLIRRLGQKLKIEYLLQEEKILLNSIHTRLPHKDSWFMFTPTELLKQYIKEAFNREGVPASEQRIKTWEDHRRYLARNVLGILKSGSGGSLILDDSKEILSDVALVDPISLYESFSSYFHLNIALQMRKSIDYLIENSNDNLLLDLVEKIDSIIGDNHKKITIYKLRSIDNLNSDISKILLKYQNSAIDTIKKSLNLLLNTDEQFLEKLAIFVKEIQAESITEQHDENEEEDGNDQLSRSSLTKDYNAAIRSLARSKIREKRLSPKTKNSKIINWLGKRLISEEKLISLGKNLEIQTNLRKFSNPISFYITRIPIQYRVFRRNSIRNNSLLYSEEKFGLNYVSSLEVDMILLLSLKNINSVINAYHETDIKENPRFSIINSIYEEHRNQILVDEATDFSPIQLACMMELANQKTLSFFACGDYNQRITAWGAHSSKQMLWVSPKLDMRSISTSYRQSKRLNSLATVIVDKKDNDELIATVPDYADNCDISPVLGENLETVDILTTWLKRRIAEIEKQVKYLPSIAIFVRDEMYVKSTADSLNEKLLDLNVRAVSCPEGKVMGQDGDIRIFDVQHIKGLEFEAVFFIDIDLLSEKMPSLFDKYLYVGITRAATYLGITCNKLLPDKIENSRKLFTKSWNQ